LLEMYDGDDRLVLDHGASGAPVLDCDGRVVAVVMILMTRTMSFLSNVIRISTAWNSPNVVAIPIQVLKDFSSSEGAPTAERMEPAIDGRRIAGRETRGEYGKQRCLEQDRLTYLGIWPRRHW